MKVTDFDLSKSFGRTGRDTNVRESGRAVAQVAATRPDDMPIAKTYAAVVTEAAIDNNTARVLEQLGIEPRDLEAVTSFSSNLALLSVRVAGFDPAAIANRGAAISEVISGHFGARAPVAAARKSVEEEELSENIGRSVDALVAARKRPSVSSVSVVFWKGSSTSVMSAARTYLRSSSVGVTVTTVVMPHFLSALIPACVVGCPPRNTRSSYLIA